MVDKTAIFAATQAGYVPRSGGDGRRLRQLVDPSIDTTSKIVWAIWAESRNDVFAACGHGIYRGTAPWNPQRGLCQSLPRRPAWYDNPIRTLWHGSVEAGQEAAISSMGTPVAIRATMKALGLTSVWLVASLVACAPRSFEDEGGAGGAVGEADEVGKRTGGGETASPPGLQSGGGQAGASTSPSLSAGGASSGGAPTSSQMGAAVGGIGGAPPSQPSGSAGGPAGSSTGGASGGDSVAEGGAGEEPAAGGRSSTLPLPPGNCQQRSLDVPWPVISGCLQPDPESDGAFTRLRCAFPAQLNVPDYGPFVACCAPEFPYSCPNGTPHSCFATAAEAEAACAGACVVCVEPDSG